MYTLDEAIKYHEKLETEAEIFGDIRGAFYTEEEHAQMVDWLRKLKTYEECEANNCKAKAYELSGYNKAIDEFAEKVLEEYRKTPKLSRLEKIFAKSVVKSVKKEMKKTVNHML